MLSERRASDAPYVLRATASRITFQGLLAPDSSYGKVARISLIAVANSPDGREGTETDKERGRTVDSVAYLTFTTRSSSVASGITFAWFCMTLMKVHNLMSHSAAEGS